jgi:RND family efflux transporter MFP subunit
MMGQVNEVSVKAGQQVKKGDLLVKISSADLQAKAAQAEAGIAQAQAAYDNAAKDYERFQNLHKSGSASDKELENMKSRYQMTKAGLDAAKNMKREVMAQFEYLNIRAPFSGTVANTFVKAGDMAAPGHPLVNLESMNKMEALVMVPEAKIKAIKIGQEALVKVKSSELSIAAKVKDVSYSSKNTGGQYLVTLSIDEENEMLLPGMYINASITTEDSSKQSKVLIPKKALVHQGQLTGIYTPSGEGVAILRWLRLGDKTEDQVEVLSGLTIGESYISKAEGRLYNGVSIVQ